MRRVLVTGGSGFIARHLLPRLQADGYSLTITCRATSNREHLQNGAAKIVVLDEIDQRTDWHPALTDCDTIIHLAAQVPAPAVPSEAFEATNDLGTARLVEQATEVGVRLFVLLSSIFAIADNATGLRLDDSSFAQPGSSYGLSKLAAEGHIARFTEAGGVGISLRPPLVYSADAQGNWALLQHLAASSLPLPFASVENRRSLIAVENLVDAIARVVGRDTDRLMPGAFVIADEVPVSLHQIMTWLRQGMSRPVRLFSIPPTVLQLALNGIGRKQMAKSLLGNLELNPRRFNETYGWSPVIAPREAIMQSGAQYVDRKTRRADVIHPQ